MLKPEKSNEESNEALDAIESLDQFIQKKMIKFESLVVVGQRMDNLLHEIICQMEDDPMYEDIVNEAKELIQRWEKEFKQ